MAKLTAAQRDNLPDSERLRLIVLPDGRKMNFGMATITNNLKIIQFIIFSIAILMMHMKDRISAIIYACLATANATGQHVLLNKHSIVFTPMHIPSLPIRIFNLANTHALQFMTTLQRACFVSRCKNFKTNRTWFRCSNSFPFRVVWPKHVNITFTPSINPFFHGTRTFA